MPGTRFVNCLDRNGPPREWTPPVRVEEHIDTWYFGRALEAMDRELRIDGLTFYLTFDPERLPSYGDDVVAVLIGDEWALVPDYITRVRAVFRNLCARPNLGCNPLAWPSAATFASLLPAARTAWRGAPGRLARARAELAAARGKGPRPAPQIVVPVGTYNLADLPVVPLGQRRFDLFFAGSVVHEPDRTARLKARVMPKNLSREAMLRNVERLTRNSGVTADIRITEGYQQSVAADPLDYSRAFMDCRLALVPRGAVVETHRFFQALKYGCIVVTDAIAPTWFHEQAPMVRLRHWDELEEAVLPLLADRERLEALHRQSLAWWESACSEAAVGRLMARTLNSLS
jgi:hypothetical protein